MGLSEKRIPSKRSVRPVGLENNKEVLNTEQNLRVVPKLREVTVWTPRRASAEPRPRGCSGLGEPRPALPSF